MKRLLVALVALAMLMSLSAGSLFAAYPDKPITYIISFNPGGESDITARMQEQALEDALGVDVVITHKIGGGGAVGWSEIQRAKPDGYTIAGTNVPHIIVQPMMRANAGYETENFAHIYAFQFTPNILAVHQDSPFDTLADFVAYAKEHPEVVTIGGSGNYSANHLGTLEMEKAADINVTYIPFSGSGAAVPALLGKHVTGLMTYTTMGIRYSDQFKVLAVASDERVASMPDVPTFKELGYDVVEGAYRGVSAPPGTPSDVIEALRAAFDKVNRDPELTAKFENLGFQLQYMDGAAYAKMVANKKSTYTSLLKELGLLK